jgi:hypothetical protein
MCVFISKRNFHLCGMPSFSGQRPSNRQISITKPDLTDPAQILDSDSSNIESLEWCKRDCGLIAKQPAPLVVWKSTPNLSAGCSLPSTAHAVHLVLLIVPRVGRSHELSPNGFDLSGTTWADLIHNSPLRRPGRPRKRERESERAREKEQERERERERERDSERERARERDRKREQERVCERENARVCERESESV